MQVYNVKFGGINIIKNHKKVNIKTPPKYRMLYIDKNKLLLDIRPITDIIILGVFFNYLHR